MGGRGRDIENVKTIVSHSGSVDGISLFKLETRGYSTIEDVWKNCLFLLWRSMELRQSRTVLSTTYYPKTPAVLSYNLSAIFKVSSRVFERSFFKATTKLC